MKTGKKKQLLFSLSPVYVFTELQRPEVMCLFGSPAQEFFSHANYT